MFTLCWENKRSFFLSINPPNFVRKNTTQTNDLQNRDHLVKRRQSKSTKVTLRSWCDLVNWPHRIKKVSIKWLWPVKVTLEIIKRRLLVFCWSCDESPLKWNKKNCRASSLSLQIDWAYSRLSIWMIGQYLWIVVMYSNCETFFYTFEINYS